MRFYLALIGCLLLVLLSRPELIQAQDASACPSYIQTTLESLGDICANALPGSSCYGNSDVAVSYASPVDTAAFAKPGDLINLSLINDLHTSAIDLKNKKWGVALLKIQANLPKAMNSKGVVMVTLGDVRIQSAVSLENALELADTPASVKVSSNGVDLFNVPPAFNDQSTFIAHLPADTIFQADGISPNGEWVRIFAPHDQPYFQSANAWVKRTELVNTASVKHLPTIGPNSLTPMQSIYLDTGLKQAACATDPTAMLYIQGPEETESQLIINGAEIRFGSTILVHILPPGNIMQVIVLSGIGILNHGAADERVITPAFASQICLSDASAKGVRTIGNNCRWSEPNLLSFSELQSLYNALDRKIPQKLQYYPSYVPQLVCPSGVGKVQCHIQLAYELLINHLLYLCKTGILPKRICDLYIWHMP